MRFCKFCGQPLTDDAMFCESCGNKVGKILMQQGAPCQEYQQYNAQPVPSNQTVGATGVNGQTAGVVGSEVIGAMTSGVGKAVASGVVVGVKAKYSVVKGMLIVSTIIAVLLAGLSAYFTYFVDGPVQVIERFFDSFNDLDITGMVECMDPTSQKQFSAAASIGSAIVGGFTGFDIDIEAMMDLFPFIYASTGEEVPKVTDIDIKSESYSGSKLTEFFNEYNIEIPGIEKALADEAVVIFTIKLSNGETETDMITLKNYGSAGWLIPGDTNLGDMQISE